MKSQLIHDIDLFIFSLHYRGYKESTTPLYWPINFTLYYTELWRVSFIHDIDLFMFSLHNTIYKESTAPLYWPVNFKFHSPLYSVMKSQLIHDIYLTVCSVSNVHHVLYRESTGPWYWPVNFTLLYTVLWRVSWSMILTCLYSVFTIQDTRSQLLHYIDPLISLSTTQSYEEAALSMILTCLSFVFTIQYTRSQLLLYIDPLI
jgi:hypothetical protein